MREHEDDKAVGATRSKPAPPDVSEPASPVTHLQGAVGNRAVAQMLSAQRSADGEELTDPAGALDRGLTSPSAPLSGDVQREMEGALGADLSTVRLHSGTDADRSATELGARAYTVGEDVVLGESVGAPSSTDGKRTLAHELTHVLQQREGPVAGTDVGGGVSVSDPSDRFERAAEASAEAVVTGGTTDHARTSAPSGASSVQRLDEDAVVQRAAPPAAPLTGKEEELPEDMVTEPAPVLEEEEEKAAGTP